LVTIYESADIDNSPSTSKKKDDAIPRDKVMPNRKARKEKKLKLRQTAWDAACAKWLRGNRGKTRSDYIRTFGNRPTPSTATAKPGAGK